MGKLYLKPVNSEGYAELGEIKELNVSDSTADKLFGEKHMADEEMMPTKYEFTSDLKASVFEWDRFVIEFCGIDE